MKIITYVSSVTDDAPERYRCAARMIMADGSMSPMVFHASTKQAARESAQTWWDEQIAKERAKVRAREERADRMRQARAAPQAQPETVEQSR